MHDVVVDVHVASTAAEVGFAHIGDSGGQDFADREVTVYEVTGEAAEKIGGVHVTEALVSPGMAVGLPAAQGTPAKNLVVVGLLVPPPPTDRTLIRYEDPLVRPDNVHFVLPWVAHRLIPGLAVTE